MNSPFYPCIYFSLSPPFYPCINFSIGTGFSCPRFNQTFCLYMFLSLRRRFTAQESRSSREKIRPVLVSLAPAMSMTISVAICSTSVKRSGIHSDLLLERRRPPDLEISSDFDNDLRLPSPETRRTCRISMDVHGSSRISIDHAWIGADLLTYWLLQWRFFALPFILPHHCRSEEVDLPRSSLSRRRGDPGVARRSRRLEVNLHYSQISLFCFCFVLFFVFGFVWYIYSF